MPETSPDNGCSTFAAEVLLTRLDALAHERAGVRAAEDIEHIHHMRVASRRLRTALGIFAECLPAKEAAAWGRDIRRITRALGAARDLDVQLEAVDAFRQTAGRREAPGLQRLRLRLQQQRTAMQVRVLRTLDRLAGDRVIEAMEAALSLQVARTRLNEPAGTPAALFRLAATHVTARLTELMAFERYVTQPDRNEELHAARIAAKRLRYTIEIFVPLYGEALAPVLKTAKTLQEQLGDIHDCDVWLDLLPHVLEDERRRALDYAGTTRGVARLAPGLRAFEDDRRAFRAARYKDFTKSWETARAAWRELLAVVQAAANASQ